MLYNQIKFPMIYNLLMFIEFFQMLSLAVDSKVTYTWSHVFTRELTNGLSVFRIDKALKSVDTKTRQRGILLDFGTISAILLLNLINWSRFFCFLKNRMRGVVKKLDDDTRDWVPQNNSMLSRLSYLTILGYKTVFYFPSLLVFYSKAVCWEDSPFQVKQSKKEVICYTKSWLINDGVLSIIGIFMVLYFFNLNVTVQIDHNPWSALPSSGPVYSYSAFFENLVKLLTPLALIIDHKVRKTIKNKF